MKHGKFMKKVLLGVLATAVATTTIGLGASIAVAEEPTAPTFAIQGRIGYTDGDWADASLSVVAFRYQQVDTKFTIDPVTSVLTTSAIMGFAAVGSSQLATDGTYSIEGLRGESTTGAADSTFTVGIFDANRVYKTQVYENKLTSDVSTGTVISITTTNVVGIDQTLTANPQRKIAGKVKFVGAAPIYGDVTANVYKNSAAEPDTFTIAYSSAVATDGTYAIHVSEDATDVPDWMVGFEDSEGVFSTYFNGGASTPASATPITITAPETVTVDGTMTAAVSKRTYGSDPIDTAIKASQAKYPTAGRGGTVVVCSADAWADSVSAGPLAKALDAPILLARKASIASEVLDEIGRLDADEVIIVGGPLAVSYDNEQAIRAAGVPVVRRLQGADKYATSAAVAQEMITRGFVATDDAGKLQTVFIVGGRSAWDAVLAAPLATAAEAPIMMVRSASVPDAVVDVLASFESSQTNVIVIGSEANVSADLEPLLMTTDASATLTFERIAADPDNRYNLSVGVADYAINALGFSARKMALVSNSGMYEALALAPQLAENRTPLLVTANTLYRRRVVDSPGAYTWMTPVTETYLSKQVTPSLDPADERLRNFEIAYLEGIGQMDSELWGYALREAGLTAP